MKLTRKLEKKFENNESGENDLDDDLDDGPVKNGTSVQAGKKRKAPNNNVSRKKLKPGRLTKQPTSEELNRLRETENLFSSNFFRLQIEEMFKEITVKAKYLNSFNKWMSNFNNFLENIEESDNYELSDRSWLSKFHIHVPVLQKPSHTKGYFNFIKCGDATIIGSHSFNCNLGPSLNVDLKIEIPKGVFYKDDYLNERYQRKRALYLAYLASALNKSGLVEDLKYKLLNECNSKPVLKFTPVCKSKKRINVTLHVCPEEDTFKLNRFSPSRNNVREDWRFGSEEIENDLTSSTPFYNSSILIDLTYNKNNQLLCDAVKGCENIRQGIVLLKIWLKQRHIYTFSGFIMSMFVVYLMKIKRINNAMSSYQVIRNVWTALAASEWDVNGISLCTSELTNQHPVVQEFHTHFPVVFIDASGFNNLCAHVNLEVYRTVKRESELAVNFLDNPNINSFHSLFMTSVDHHLKYDHIIRIQCTKKLESMIMENTDKNQKLDCGPDTFPIIKKYLCGLLRKGLGDRVSVIMPKCRAEDELCWPIDSDVKNNNPLKNPIEFGLKLNTEFAFNLVDRGPEANLPETESFREFWGTKSELRRFQDGTILETCVWETNPTTASKRLIVKKIIYYLLQVKLGVEEKFFYIADQFEDYLRNNRYEPANFDYGTGEEAALKVSLSLNELTKNLRSLTDLPLEITSVQGTSPVFSYSDPIPPLPNIWTNTKGQFYAGKYKLIPDKVKTDASKENQANELFCPGFTPASNVVIQLTHSGKWPEDLEALHCVKTAFYIQIAEALRHQCSLTVYPRKNYIDVFKDGYVFRIEISHQKEIALLKKIVDKDGIIKYVDNDESSQVEYELMILPRIRVALNGLYQHHQCFGPTASLTKRWIRSHLIDASHFPDICIDLLVASIFIRPEPYEVPVQPQVGFWRVLKTLATVDWNTHMLLLNFNDDLEKEELLEIESNFSTNRSTLPPLYIVTPYENKKNSIYSKNGPSFKILARLQILALEALDEINSLLFTNQSNNIHGLFKPNTEGFDVLIHLKTNFNPLRYLKQKTYANYKPNLEKLTPYEKTDRELIPVIDFNPIQIYLNNLRSSYDEYALFFHDTYGGSTIAVLWKPSALEFRDFKTSHTNGRKPCVKDKKNGIIVDIDSIMEGFYLLGEGIVKDIENVSNAECR